LTTRIANLAPKRKRKIERDVWTRPGSKQALVFEMLSKHQGTTLDALAKETPKSIVFKLGALLGSVPGELGLRKYLETQCHTLVVTSDKDGANSVLDRELPHTEIVISQPFWRRLKPFDMHLHYLDRPRLQEAVEKEPNLTWHPNAEDMVKVCKMKRGAYSVNTAREKICDRDAIVRALESGQPMRAMYGSHSQRQRTIRGAPCRIMV
jgi:hypothetical protein